MQRDRGLWAQYIKADISGSRSGHNSDRWQTRSGHLHSRPRSRHHCHQRMRHRHCRHPTLRLAASLPLHQPLGLHPSSHLRQRPTPGHLTTLNGPMAKATQRNNTLGILSLLRRHPRPSRAILGPNGRTLHSPATLGSMQHSYGSNRLAHQALKVPFNAHTMHHASPHAVRCRSKQVMSHLLPLSVNIFILQEPTVHPLSHTCSRRRQPTGSGGLISSNTAIRLATMLTEGTPPWARISLPGIHQLTAANTLSRLPMAIQPTPRPITHGCSKLNPASW